MSNILTLNVTKHTNTKVTCNTLTRVMADAGDTVDGHRQDDDRPRRRRHEKAVEEAVVAGPHTVAHLSEEKKEEEKV